MKFVQRSISLRDLLNLLFQQTPPALPKLADSLASQQPPYERVSKIRQICPISKLYPSADTTSPQPTAAPCPANGHHPQQLRSPDRPPEDTNGPYTCPQQQPHEVYR